MQWSGLSSGDVVEVSDDRGESTWQSASIIHRYNICRIYLVAFDTGMRDNVSSVRVRPRPESQLFTSNFELDQLVDVKIGGVWRPGVVYKVHVTEGKKFYRVNVGGREMDIENGSAEIRASVDWIDGKWALATEKGKPIKSHNLGNSNSNSEVLHEKRNSHECKVTNVVNPMRDLIEEAPLEKSIAIPMPNIENKDLDKENKGCSNNLNFRSRKSARKEVTIKDNSRILNIEKTKHSECLESSSLKKLEFDVCMPISKEDSNFNIKSMVDKLHYNGLFETRESNINNLSQESSRLCNKAEHCKEKSLLNEPLQSTKLWSKGVWSHTELRKIIFFESEGLLNKAAYRHTSGESRRKNSKPQKLVIVEPSLEGGSFEKRQGKPICSEQQNAVVIDASSNEAMPKIKKTSLPFEKCSHIWESFKLMKIFTVMPQEPHFSPLVEQCEVYREGMAIGLMVTFSSIVHSISELNLSDPPKKFDGIANALLNLQSHGFNVQKAQSRLTELIKLKENYERLASKISKLKMVRAELTMKIESNGGILSEVEQTLSHLHELRNWDLSEEKEIDYELDKLTMELKKFDDDIADAELGFEAVRSSFP